MTATSSSTAASALWILYGSYVVALWVISVIVYARHKGARAPAEALYPGSGPSSPQLVTRSMRMAMTGWRSKAIVSICA